LVKRNGADKLVARNVHAQKLGEVTQVLDLEYGAKPSFERRQLGAIIAYDGNIVHAEGDDGEDGWSLCRKHRCTGRGCIVRAFFIVIQKYLRFTL
jgi:hypothetical protein